MVNKQDIRKESKNIKEGEESAQTKVGESQFSEEVVSFVKFVIYMAILVIFIRGTIVEAYRIPSASMRPALIEQDYILVTKFDFGLRASFFSETLYQYASPDRFDVVVFTLKEDSHTNIIKRVIGLPGETVEVKGMKVYINGKLLKEPPTVNWRDGGIKDFGPRKIPEGHVFLMGDNRDRSRDARFWDEPFLDIKRIKGKARIIYFNLDKLSRIGTLIK